MPAEIIEQSEDYVAPEEPSTIPADTEAMSPEEVAEAFTPSDTTVQEPTEDDLPEKYKGKSIKEVISMHQEAEKLIGSQGSEVGELRKVVDSYIQNQMQAQQHTNQQPEPEPVDFFEDPEKAVSQAIETHPDVVHARQQAAEMKRASSLTQLQSKHPDMATVLQSEAFTKWVLGSDIRKELYARADKDYDFNAADELISNFKERAQLAQQTVKTETAARQQAVRQASTGSAAGTNTSGSKRVYRRADIIKLMKTDPDRYEALSGEIMQAYAEGRVK